MYQGRLHVMRRSVTVAAWVITLLMGVTMFWTLTAGGFLAAMAEGSAAVDESVLALSYVAIGSIVAVTMAYATVGLLIAARTGGGRVGAVLLAGGLAFAAIPFGYVVGGALVLREPLDPVANAVFLLGPACIAIGYAMILPVLALVFPHGTLPSRRWRWPAGVVATMLVASTLIRVFTPGEIAGTTSRNPFGIDALPAAVAGLADLLAGLGIMAVSVLGVAAVLVRYRRGSMVVRQQLRWFVGAVLLAVIPIAISPQPGIGGPIWILLASIGLLLVPVSVGIAVTRYHLYEIDRIISRTIGWAIVSGMLAAVFAGVVIALQGLLAGFTQGQTAAVAASTLFAFALFQPLRRRVQGAVDRRFDRARYDGQRTVDAFAGRLRDEVDLGQIRARTLATVGETVRPAHAAVWLRGPLPRGPG